jgi:hypothetical protein
MDEDLDYNFTEGSGVLGGANNKDPDTANVSVLKQIANELKVMKAEYGTIDRLNLDDKHFTIEQQLANNKWAVTLIGTIELMINEKLKEIQ